MSKRPQQHVNMSHVASIILGGGQGTRLFPLTNIRCKPAICFGGRYCLIDVPISNALNSKCNKIFILTQFLSSSLHKHIFNTYQMGRFSEGFIEILAAEQKPLKNNWFQGTADAVRQNCEYFLDTSAEYFLILSGDQLYNFDFRNMVQFAMETDADLVVASLPVSAADATRMGILKVDTHNRITDFVEKPQTLRELEPLSSSKESFDRLQLTYDPQRPYLGSMGIYLFKRETMFKLLEEDSREDFGKHLIPTQVKKGGVFSFVFDGYWEDIGTIEAFYKANMALTDPRPPFNCYDERNPIYTAKYDLAPPKIANAHVSHSIICEGTRVEAARVTKSIIGPRTIVRERTVITDSYLMGNDSYTTPFDQRGLSVGADCVIHRAILDKNVHLGDGVQLVNKGQLTHYDGDHVFIRDGVIVVTRGASLPNGFIL
jgi:glucose-1-phosphate adenylyltransferase